jgi:uncharacterized protein (TIGR02466 family)
MNMHHLFPIAIGMFDLDRQLTDEELLFFRGQETRPNMGNSTSTDNFILRQQNMTGLRGWIEDCVAEYFKATSNPTHDVHLRITQSWLNYSEQGQFHHKHAHPNSFVSGVFYINTNPDDRIYFYKDGYEQIKFPPKEWNIYNSESWWFEAITGRLILFPSSLQHMVPNVQGEDVRISLSFNTFPVGIVGEEMSLTGLKLEA